MSCGCSRVASGGCGNDRRIGAAILCELMFSIAVEAVDDGGAAIDCGEIQEGRDAVDAPAFPVSLVEIVKREHAECVLRREQEVKLAEDGDVWWVMMWSWIFAFAC